MAGRQDGGATKDLLDPAAGQDGFVVVEDGALAWGDGALGSFEGDAGAIVGESFDGGGGGVVLVTNLCLAEDRRGWLRDGNPIYIFNFECARAQRFVFADDNAVVLRIYRKHIDGLAGCEAEAFALADSVIVCAGVAADDRAVFGDDVAFLIVHSNSLGAGIGVDELDVVAVWNEAEFHAFGLFGDGKIRVARDVAHFFFREFT